MKRFLIVILLLIGYISQAQKPITVLSMGFGKDFINGQAMINANFIVKNAYASYSLSVDNTVKSYDVGWAFQVKHFYFIPTLGVTSVTTTDNKRYYQQTVTDNDITITEIQVDVDGGTPSISKDSPPISLSGSSVISIIDRIEVNTKNHPNIGLFAGYQFNDGLTLFIKATNNSLGAGMGYIFN